MMGCPRKKCYAISEAKVMLFGESFASINKQKERQQKN